jgi:hypothetical protein
MLNRFCVRAIPPMNLEFDELHFVANVFDPLPGMLNV